MRLALLQYEVPHLSAYRKDIKGTNDRQEENERQSTTENKRRRQVGQK